MAGYHVTILFLSLPSADLAVQRVRWRVAQGGHAIPEEVIGGDLRSGWQFENLYKPRADAWALYDSSGEAPILLDWGEKR
jgi:predicted ABC-type ATPase